MAPASHSSAVLKSSTYVSDCRGPSSTQAGPQSRLHCLAHARLISHFDPDKISRMPKRTDIQSILIIGAGPIIIGQACEFDYSGAQACKALRAEGYRVILVNSNPATIMTDPGLADATYVEPITPEMVEKIIAREKPDAMLPTMGGQTALNTAMRLAANGALERHGVELIGAKADVIDRAEDRLKFRDAMAEIGIEFAPLGHRALDGGSPRRPCHDRPAGGHPPQLHPRRHRRRHRLQQAKNSSISSRAAWKPPRPPKC